MAYPCSSDNLLWWRCPFPNDTVEYPPCWGYVWLMKIRWLAFRYIGRFMVQVQIDLNRWKFTIWNYWILFNFVVFSTFLVQESDLHLTFQERISGGHPLGWEHPSCWGFFSSFLITLACVIKRKDAKIAAWCFNGTTCRTLHVTGIYTQSPCSNWSCHCFHFMVAIHLNRQHPPTNGICEPFFSYCDITWHYYVLAFTFVTCLVDICILSLPRVSTS